MTATIPEGGLRFGCTGCGDCCRRRGWVSFSGRERGRMARYLGLAPRVFDRRFGVRAGDGAFHIEVPGPPGCPLLGPTGLCSVHPAKPKQCATYPFWVEVLETEDTWRAEAALCPGIEHAEGRLYPREELVQIRAGRSRT